MSDDNTINTPLTARGTPRKRAVSAEQHERNKKNGWQKGQTGNPKGRPKDDPEFEAARQAAVRRSLTRMDDLAENCENVMVRYKANEWLLNTELSKAVSKQEIEVSHVHDLTPIIAAMNADNTAMVIDVQPEEAPPLCEDRTRGE